MRNRGWIAAMAWAPAAWAAESPVVKALEDIHPLFDARLRYERVDQDPFAQDAQGLTLRARFGFETGKAWGTSVLVEGEGVVPLDTHYNSTTNGHAQYPVVADPEAYEVNRLQLTNTSLDGTTLTLGRQRIILDDHRFVGNVGWRQNEQTYDGLRVVNRSVAGLTVDLSYVNRINRVFGPRGLPGANDGRLHGNTFLGNVAYQTPLGKLTGFAYLIQFDETPLPARDSSRTLGLRFAGERPLGPVKLGYVASYARQADWRNNPLRYRDDYALGELTATYREVSLGGGYERLDGDGVKGFTTPLATLHRFQGWADKFLTTPVNGIDDAYVNVGWQRKKVGFVDALAFQASWHDYRSARLAIDYGSEWDLQLQAKVHRVTGTVKYAAYEAAAATPALRDTGKLWLQLEFAW